MHANRNSTLFAMLLALVAGAGCKEASSPNADPSSATTIDGMIAAAGFRKTSMTITNDRFPVDPSKFVAQGVGLMALTDDPLAMPNDTAVTNTAEVRQLIAAANHRPVTIERVLALAAANPQPFWPGPVVALGSQWVDEKGVIHVPAVLREDDAVSVYAVTANPDDGWNHSFKFAIE